MLYGPPGVGKTLTAETVAEYTQKPLYPLNIGELSASTDVVAHLQKAFDTASRWDAVLLLDEADVLLEKRSYENLVRNGIVSGTIVTSLAESLTVLIPSSVLAHARVLRRHPFPDHKPC